MLASAEAFAFNLIQGVTNTTKCSESSFRVFYYRFASITVYATFWLVLLFCAWCTFIFQVFILYFEMLFAVTDIVRYPRDHVLFQ